MRKRVFFFWIIHSLWIFILVTLTLGYAATRKQDITTIPNNVRVVDIIPSKFGSQAVLSTANQYYVTRGNTLILGTTFYPTDWKIKKVFQHNNGFDSYWLGRGVLAEVTIEIPKHYTCDISCKILQSREWMRRKAENAWRTTFCPINPIICYDATQFASGLVLGGSTKFSDTLKSRLLENNLYHIVVVSGFQIAIVSLALERLLNWLKMPIVPKFTIIITLLIIYAYITGWEPPVTRSFVSVAMSLSVLLFLGRAIGPWQSLCYSAVTMVLLWPHILYSKSFQLSVLATTGLLFAESLIKKNQLRNLFQIITITTCTTFLFVLPITSSFGTAISPLGILANCIILPLIPILSLLAVLTLIPYFNLVVGPGFIYLFSLVNQALSWLHETSKANNLVVQFVEFQPIESILYWGVLIILLSTCLFLPKKAVDEK